ncbi:glycosyl hydrolase [Rugamonas sp. FT82W]|uniref:Glycosyl hydrolase n=2 Tax=Duganella vulcania TaxID=2692166 RepID=A0A845G025_9BURK|nr:glycosyl hydrolase [Duganella vulcania]
MAAACWAVVAINSARAEPVFQAPPDVAAARSELAIRAPLNALANAGRRLVAAGQRGHILYSDDGRTWVQAAVPVSSDLVALSFPTPAEGWAVGHDGVVLHTTDGGANWLRQLDRRMTGIGAFGDAAGTGPAPVGDAVLLDVWFADLRSGFAVGAFGLILHTADGGKNWTAWTARADNPRGMHLYAIRPVNGELYIAGEQGLLLKFDRTLQRFVKIELPYKGSLFGVSGANGLLLVYGLRGNAFRSTDGGANWEKADTGISAGLTGCLIRGDGSVVLSSQAGHVLLSRDRGKSFRLVSTAPAAPIFAMVALDEGNIALSGIGGIRLEAVK